ncbi:hypothetical protein, conserved [Leishmania tarentolae]|uniref:Uncharacterized protein n=1 Tax=Leishmania tarentolae TaxID=5689 RepID=A0A640KHD9_LEITA|nr:hypothetical protein, conserved [Leishmania tarentolae]
MWAALPPVVPVVTAADELAGVSMAAHTSGMMCEPTSDSHPPATVTSTLFSRPSTLNAPSAVDQHHTSVIPHEHLASANNSQYQYRNSTASPPPAVGNGAACETVTPITAAATGGAWNQPAYSTSHFAPPSLQQPRIGRNTFTSQPPPPAVGAPSPVMSPPAARPTFESLSSPQAVASPGQDLLDCSPSARRIVSRSIEVTAADTRQSPSLGSTCVSSVHQAQPPFPPSGTPASLAAADGPAGGTMCTSTMMLPSVSLHAASTSTAPTNGGTAPPLLASAPTARTHDSTVAHAAVNSFQDWSSGPLTEDAATTAADKVGALSWAEAEYQAQNHPAPEPLASPFHTFTSTPVLTATPHAPAIADQNALRRLSSPSTFVLNPGGGAEKPNIGAGVPRRVLDRALCSTTLPKHNHSFYMGTVGNENLNRSFLFPISSSCGAAVAASSTDDASIRSTGGAGPTTEAISHVRSPNAACGRSGGPTSPLMEPISSAGVTAYGVSDPAPPSETGFTLGDTYRSLTLFELPPDAYTSQLLQGQLLPHQLHPHLQQSLQLTPTPAAKALPPPGTDQAIFWMSPQMASLHEALPGLAQPLSVSYASYMDRRSSLNQSPALQQLSTAHSRSLSVNAAAAAAAAGETSRNAGVTNSSFISPTLANLKWHCRFDASLSGSVNAIEISDNSVQVTGSTPAALAAGDRRGDASSRPCWSISNAKLEPRPAYIVEWEQSLIAFQNRAESYYAFKNVCTETYLTLIEHNVDRFLVCYFSGGVMRPEKSLQEALTSRSRVEAHTTVHLFGGTGIGNLNAKRLGHHVASGAGIQKMLQGTKALQRLSETGSKWLTKIGVNLRRTAETPAPVSSEPQTVPVSEDPSHWATATSADTVAPSPTNMGEGSPDCRTTSMTIGVSGAATEAVEGGMPEPTYTSLCDTDTIGASFTPSAAPGQLPPPTTGDSIALPSKDGSTLPSVSLHNSVTTTTGIRASTMATAQPARVCAEEAEIQCLRQLGPYVANVIPETFMDARPSDGVLDQVRRNYAILLHTLQRVLLDSDGCSGRVADAFSPSLGSSPPSPTPATEPAESPDPPTMDQLVSQRIREGLLLPTIRAIWRDYLTPLKSKLQELTEIAKTSIDPILGDLQKPKDTGSTGGAAAMPLMTSESSGRVLRHDSTVAATPFTKGTGPSSVPMTDAERAAREALRASWEGPVSRLIRLLRGDGEYLATIQTMDSEFDEGGAGWQESSAQLRLRGAALSDYVPVYGLVLSRLHRLEMEHRTVLELWGSSAAAAAGTQHRMYA